MNKKHLVSIIAIVALVAVLTTVLVGCNKFEWNSIGGGNPDATVESNGGYYVKQGEYVYFINGYDTNTTVDNTWGTPVKNAIVRAEIDRAMEQQAGTVDPRRSILDQAMDSRIELLQQQIAELKRENAKLLAENQRLQKALNKKSLNIIKNL